MNKAIFHSKNWFDASIEEKLQALQELENEYAQRQGRSPAKIELKEEAEKVEVNGEVYEKLAGLSKSDNTIVIGRKLLEYTIEDLEHQPDLMMNNVFACHAILHEGRHSYQYYAIHHPEIHADQKEVQKWKENERVYYQAPEIYYFFQPLERDAENFADHETKKIFQELEKEFGKDKNFELYKMKREIEQGELKLMSMKYFEKDLESTIQIVEEKISQEYREAEKRKAEFKKELQEMKEKDPIEVLKGLSTDDRDRKSLNEAVQERRELFEQVISKDRDYGIER
ncbi:hypothetical protein NYE37_13730 [Thermoactinomyces sp. FSL K6-2592]|jgi:hypothetical protein|uniref:hypothetical protein n=1 Tax=Thermoactinomyces sp. FSL K6-2592 TaxID=2975347 RepID=UPI0030FB62EB